MAAALLMLPLTIFAALAVDVGGWAVHANRLQVAADAAALSGATALPDHALARAAALDAATKNGFTNGDGPVVVTVDFPADLEIRVEITDLSDQYLSQVVLSSGFEIRRFAVATSAPALAFASPSNVFGFGPYSLNGAPVSNFFSGEASDCNRANIGDIRAAQLWFEPWCSPAATPREEWKRFDDGRDAGYRYVITIPPELTTSSRLYIWDPGKCPGYGIKPRDHEFGHPGRGTDLSFRQWSTSGTTGVRSDDVLVSDYGHRMSAQLISYPQILTCGPTEPRVGRRHRSDSRPTPRVRLRNTSFRPGSATQ